MGLTLIEKILEIHGAENPAPGRMVWLAVDLRTARDFGGANVVRRLRQTAGRHPDTKLRWGGKTFTNLSVGT